MNKIGTTTSGTVIVEMTADEYAALPQSLPTKPRTQSPAKPPLPLKAVSAVKQLASPQADVDRVALVKKRLLKLNPKKRDALAHCIETMFQFTGGIKAAQVDSIITRLQKERFLTIGSDDKVTIH